MHDGRKVEKIQVLYSCVGVQGKAELTGWLGQLNVAGGGRTRVRRLWRLRVGAKTFLSGV